MRFSKSVANKIFAANPLIIGVAILALAAFSPRLAFAFVGPTLTLAPPFQIDPSGGSHTVTATLTGAEGHCAEFGTCFGGILDTGANCITDSDCEVSCSPITDPDTDEGLTPCSDQTTCTNLSIGDDFCSFSGQPVAFQVTGQNSEDTIATDHLTNVLGVASFTYPDTNGIGSDSIRACADLGNNDPPEPASECLSELITDPTTDIGSNTVTKQWTAALAGTVVVTPPSAINTVNPITPASHTVTATVTGVARCTGGTNDGTLCADDFACTGGGLCTDKSGMSLGFSITGRNPSDGFLVTDAAGAVSLTYPDTNGAGLDLIQACLDADPEDFLDPDTSVAICIGGVGSENDFASNIATKRWDPSLLLQNQDAITTLFSTNPAFNPVGSSHTVSATIVGAAKICFGGNGSLNYKLCSTDADCAGTYGATCGIAGYPVFFGVTAGPNTGDLGGAVLTNSLGVATKTYPDVIAGVDTIQSCVDADLSEIGIGGVADDTSFTECNGDYPGQADVPSNTVTKFWLKSFVTGGGKWTKPDKSWDSFGGTVGQKPASTATVGEWDETAHASKGGNVSCHWNTFNSLKFSCTVLANCVTTPDTVQFVASAGKCSGATSQTVTVTIVDGRKKPDKISVTGGTGAGTGANLNVNPPVALGTGNFTLHP